jgi:hypothetical protein
MAGLRFSDLRSQPTEFLDFTSLTPGEFPQLVLRLCRKFFWSCTSSALRIMPSARESGRLSSFHH